MRQRKMKQKRVKPLVQFDFIDIVLENCEVFRFSKDNVRVLFYKHTGAIKEVQIKNASKIITCFSPSKSISSKKKRIIEADDITAIDFLKVTKKKSEKNLDGFKSVNIFLPYLQPNPDACFCANIAQSNFPTKNGVVYKWVDLTKYFINTSEDECDYFESTLYLDKSLERLKDKCLVHHNQFSYNGYKQIIVQDDFDIKNIARQCGKTLSFLEMYKAHLKGR